MFRWTIAGEGFWSMSFELGSRAKLARTVAFWREKPRPSRVAAFFNLINLIRLMFCLD